MTVQVLIVDDQAGFRRAARVVVRLPDFEVVGDAETGEASVEDRQRLSTRRRGTGQPVRWGVAPWSGASSGVVQMDGGPAPWTLALATPRHPCPWAQVLRFGQYA